MDSSIETTYSRVLSICILIGFVGLLIVYGLYVSGAAEPRVGPDQVPRFWHLKAADYLAATGQAPGWSWIRNPGSSDRLCLLGVAFLGTVVIICYGVMLAVFIRRREHLYAVIVILQILVLVLAASGVLSRSSSEPGTPAPDQPAAVQ